MKCQRDIEKVVTMVATHTTATTPQIALSCHRHMQNIDFYHDAIHQNKSLTTGNYNLTLWNLKVYRRAFFRKKLSWADGFLLLVLHVITPSANIVLDNDVRTLVPHATLCSLLTRNNVWWVKIKGKVKNKKDK